MAFPAPNILASGTTWAELQASGASGHLERLITANLAGTAAPTVAATVAESGSAGTLPAATYFVVVTETNGVGETTASPVSSGQAITGTEELVVTFQSLKTGNTARNTYVGTASGGPFTLAASGTTASTVTIASLPANSYAVHPPTVNSTAFSYTDANGNTLNAVYQMLRSAKDGNLEDVYRVLSKTVGDFLHGDPMPFSGTTAKLRHVSATFAILSTLVDEIGTLIDANAGTLSPSQNGIGNSTITRTWP